MKEDRFQQLREQMVRCQIEARGIRDPKVLAAMRQVPRERFVAEHLREFAYEDAPLPISGQQTISQPYIVAVMIEALALTGGETVLDVGTGSGYAAAVLARIVAKVYSIERVSELVEQARTALAKNGFDNVEVVEGDGTRGWPAHAPYDAIVVAAGGPKVPESLKQQLKIGGRLVMPVSFDRHTQALLRIVRVDTQTFETEELADVRFVPLLGEEGWTPGKSTGGAPEPGSRGPGPKSDLATASRPVAGLFR